MPYIPKITVKIRPSKDFATISPKPIVVITVNEYHKPSPKLVIFSSNKGNKSENATMTVNKPIKISRAYVLIIILNKTLNFKVDEAALTTSRNAVMVTNVHTIKITTWTGRISPGNISPIPNKNANRIRIPFKT